MKRRIVATLTIIALYICAGAFWALIESPVRGSATAAQLDDTIQSYVVATAVSRDFAEKAMSLACAGLIIIIWCRPAKKANL